MRSLAIVPAAGKAERFGGGKLTAPLGGEPLLNHTLRSLLDGGVSAVVVVVGPESDLTGVTLLDDARVRRVVNPEPARGMFSSIKTGLAAGDGNPILILPGDMPFVRSSTIAVLLRKSLESLKVVSPVYHGRRGHPVVIPGVVRDEILRSGTGETLASTLQGTDRVDVDVSDPGVLRDVDVRGDLPK